MSRYVAFLRAINLGSRRIKNDELCTHFAAMGFAGVGAFLASGNVIFDARLAAAEKLAARIERRLEEALGYEVATFVRTAEEVRAIARCEPFGAGPAPAGGKLQVALLSCEPGAAARETVLGLETAQDRLAIDGRELFWLPGGQMSRSDLDLSLIEATLGPMTIRTKRTVERLAARFLDG